MLYWDNKHMPTDEELKQADMLELADLRGRLEYHEEAARRIRERIRRLEGRL